MNIPWEATQDERLRDAMAELLSPPFFEEEPRPFKRKTPKQMAAWRERMLEEAWNERLEQKRRLRA